MLQVQLDMKHTIRCEIIPMGKDYTLCVYGGDLPHIGSVVLAEARPSLTGNGTGVTSSVINRISHKDEVIARMFAEALSKEKNCVVVCSCGIHFDNASPEQLETVLEQSRELCKQMIKSLRQEAVNE